MGRTEHSDSAFTRQGRIVAIVIVVGGLLAIFAPALVSVAGLPARYEMLFYLASLAAFVWAFAVALRMLRSRSGDQG